jgi:hypothetical protein
LNELISFFISNGFIAEVAGDTPSFIPARDICTLRISTIMEALDDFPGNGNIPERGKVISTSFLISKLNSSRSEALGDMTLKDLAVLSDQVEFIDKTT